MTGDDEIVIQGDVKDDLWDVVPEKWPEVFFEDSSLMFLTFECKVTFEEVVFVILFNFLKCSDKNFLQCLLC